MFIYLLRTAGDGLGKQSLPPPLWSLVVCESAWLPLTHTRLPFLLSCLRLFLGREVPEDKLLKQVRSFLGARFHQPGELSHRSACRQPAQLEKAGALTKEYSSGSLASMEGKTGKLPVLSNYSGGAVSLQHEGYAWQGGLHAGPP